MSFRGIFCTEGPVPPHSKIANDWNEWERSSSTVAELGQVNSVGHISVCPIVLVIKILLCWLWIIENYVKLIE